MKRRLLAGALLAASVLVVWLCLRKPGPAAAPAPPATTAASPSSAPTIAAGTGSLVSLIQDGLRDPSPAGRDHAGSILLPRLVRLNPEAAARLAEAWERGPVRDELLGIVAHEWATTDLAGALAWLTALADPADRSIAATATLALLAPSDPAGALELGRWLGEGTNDGRLEHTLQLWTEQHPDEAVAWVRSQPAGPWQDRLLARVVHVRAQQDPPAAAALASTGLPAGSVRDDALVNVARQWGVRDPAAASAWVESLPAGLLQNRARAELARASGLR